MKLENDDARCVVTPAIVKRIEINLHGQTRAEIQRALQMAIQEIGQSMTGGAGGGRDYGYSISVN